MQVCSLDPGRGSSEIWNAFLQRNEQSHFYQQYEWKAVNERALGHRTHYLAARGEHGIAGVFPIVSVHSRLFGRILCSMPFVNFGGLAVDNNRAENALIDHAIEIAESEHADFLEIRSLRRCERPMPTSTHKVAMSVRLHRDPEVLWSGFRSKHRTAIRRVYSDGVRVISGRDELLDTFYNLMLHSWRGLGTPIYGKHYFRSILEAFGEQIRIFVAYKDETPVATAFNGHFKGTVEGMWAGGMPEYRSLQANYVLYWEMIKDACERGFQDFNLGRSTVDSGAEAFKKKWNAIPQPLYWQYYLPRGSGIPELNPSNSKYRIAVALWRRLPVWATRMIGPRLAKSIP